MSGWMVITMGVLNILTGLDLMRSGNIPMGGVFLCYGVACGCMYYATR